MAPVQIRGRWTAHIVVLALLMMASAIEAGAQEREAALVRGRVTSEGASIALPGVTVELVEAGRRTLTDARGTFRFADVEPGSYTLRFSLIGHGVWEEPLQVTGTGVHERAVDLGADPVALGPVLVLLNRTRLVGSSVGATDLPGSAHVLGLRTLEARKDVFDDVHKILREVPGVHVQEEEGFGLRPNIGMRGTGSDRSAKITLMEDGVLVAPAPYAAPAAYYFPVVGRMEAVEVRKGSSQIRHGPFTVGGALNLVSSSIPSSLSVLVDAAGGEQATRKLRVRAGDAGERFGWLLETYQLGTNGFKQLDGGGPTGFDVKDYVAKMRVNTPLAAATYQELELKLGHYDETSDETYLGVTQDDFRTNPLRRYVASQQDVMRADHQQVHLRHFARRGPLDVTTTAYYNGFARNWYKLQSVGGRSPASVLDEPDTHAGLLAILRGADSEENALTVRANNREYYARGVQTAVGWSTPAAGGHDLEVGVRYHQDSEDRFQHDDRYAMRGGEMALTSRGAPGSQDNRVGRAAAWSLYVQDRFQIGQLMVSPGLRHENITFERHDYARTDPGRVDAPTVRENSVTAWIPGVGASYELSREVRLFGGAHRGFAPPGPGANRDTRPEYSVNYELGMRLARADAQVQALGFVSDYTNILGAETLASGTEGTGNLYNGGAAGVWGAELSAEADLSSGASLWSLPVHAAYTYTHAAFKSDFESAYEPWGTVSAGDELPYIPAHQFFARGGFERGELGGNLSATYVSAMRTEAGSGAISRAAATDGYLVLGVSAEYDLGGNTTLYGAVENLTDRSYVVARRPAGLRPGLPRTLQLGIRMVR
jgi:Fe(3+) dicitrate transport protein